MKERVIASVDVGTTKVSVLIGEIDQDGELIITGASSCPARGLKRGMIIHMEDAISSIAAALERAERLAGKRISTAYIGVSGTHIASLNSSGCVAISPYGRDIAEDDVDRALEIARAVALPANREVVHVVPRGYSVDGVYGIQNPIGMSGFRLEVDTHIVTGAVSSLLNLTRCVQHAGIEVEQLVVSSLAASEAVLNEGEAEMGIVVLDIGGGTTDMAIFADGAVCHTAVLPIGGNLITNDIAIGLRLPISVAEQLKILYGHSNPAAIRDDDMIDLMPFITGCSDLVPRKLLSEIIEARVEELCGMVLNEIRKAGYEGLLPAGIVLTGGSANLPGIRTTMNQYVDLPTRVGAPFDLYSFNESVNQPAYATAAGLLLWGMRYASSPAYEERITEDPAPIAISPLERFVKALIS
ncbi:cell division protein FtsA [Thermosporothrix hazakensis]|jgi:cell division protein FtsA|uniref:Cell division protein FtsA n=2 Tax=Thermosporothrix TaxID=768650 RepID=A0A326U6R4_THEHA|nr:cell division protein FtsA [Thermosporothrix hazakensis]PZW30488.1 cell division protein FtsA [Thermosporothrix hazakensis]BBH91202.1 cell division protein FtsA [Thermosporothrix sp. COM3]GCE49348.1 cell division protein FtsA [Thermosporothrix hazakensis]